MPASLASKGHTAWWTTYVALAMGKEVRSEKYISPGTFVRTDESFVRHNYA
jgi:hypothetical protein